ncbi:PCNP family protein [Megaselia abdita]
MSSRKREFSSNEEEPKTKTSKEHVEEKEKTPENEKVIPAPPSKISKGFSLTQKSKGGIQIKLNATKSKADEKPKLIKVAKAFNNDSDSDEVEEMPAECRMRMRNIGRDTPTSSGPNSFGKTKMGFIDSKKIFEKSLREAAAE